LAQTRKITVANLAILNVLPKQWSTKANAQTGGTDMKKSSLHTIVGVMLIALLASAAPAFSQDKRVEINPFFGYSFSDGVTVQPIEIGGEVLNAVDVKDGFSFGVSFGYYVNENIEVGFLVSRQNSALAVEGTNARDLVDMPVYNYHGIFTYNFGDGDAMIRPFLMGGLGATNYAPGEAEGVDVDNETKLSTTWGAGLKLYPNPSVGFSLMGRWTPTYIRSDPGGYWCGWYGCWLVGDPQYANQFELTGGVSFRF
jgi:hypothetical protein